MPITKVACPTDCNIGELPAVNFSDCNPETNLSEIIAIYVGRKDTTAFTDASLAPEWAKRILAGEIPSGNTDVTEQDVIRPLTVLGSIDAPADSTVNLSGARDNVPIKRVRTLTATIDETNDDNYNFMRIVECAKAFKAKIWYETRAGKLYGGNEGIDATLKIVPVNATGAESIETFTFTATWDSMTSPDRCVSPIAH